jgi:TonB family protein
MTPKFGVWILAAASCLSAPLAWTAESPDALSLIEKPEAGDVASQLALGIAAEDKETNPDYATAAKWYQRASEGGSGAADWQLGMLYETGEGVPQSYEQARRCYERAVERGIEAANMRLGLFYLEGWGVQADRQKMLTLITRAADSGYVPAMNMLSGMYFSGVGVARDGKQALAWAERAAVLDDREGQMLVGHMATRGLGVKRDLKLAREWYQMSAEQEYSTAMLAMAATFLKKGATPEDRVMGKRWLELALENQSAEAGFLLAIGEFTSPEGLTPQAEERARSYLKKAVALGSLAASEVFQWEEFGKTLRDATHHVATVPMEVRYVERSAYRASQGTDQDRPPKMVKAVRPVYPASMRLAGQDGQVVVRFVVDTKGFVKSPKIISTSHPAFAESALQAVRQFRYEPGMKNGRMVSARMQLPIYFNLKEPTSPLLPSSSAPREKPPQSD